MTETFKVHCDYIMPSKSELEKIFLGGVSNIFDGRPFEYHESCKDLDKKPKELEMVIKHFDRGIQSEKAIIKTEGYRPITHLELYALARAYPELQKQFWIVALGSFTRDGSSYRHVGVLDAYDGGPILDGYWFHSKWGDGYRFPFVRKGSSAARTLGSSEKPLDASGELKSLLVKSANEMIIDSLHGIEKQLARIADSLEKKPKKKK